MHVVARYNDGWTERQLRWNLQAVGGIACVIAHWNDDDYIEQRREWRGDFDETMIRDNVDALRGMAEQYRSASTDVEDCELIVAEGDDVIRRYVEGGSELRKDMRELDPFYRVWDRIEALVLTGLSRVKDDPGAP